MLFYFSLFISKYTPKFFAIENIETALNPKLCSKLITVLVELAKKYVEELRAFQPEGPYHLGGSVRLGTDRVVIETRGTATDPPAGTVASVDSSMPLMVNPSPSRSSTTAACARICG